MGANPIPQRLSSRLIVIFSLTLPFALNGEKRDKNGGQPRARFRSDIHSNGVSFHLPSVHPLRTHTGSPPLYTVFCALSLIAQKLFPTGLWNIRRIVSDWRATSSLCSKPRFSYGIVWGIDNTGRGVLPPSSHFTYLMPPIVV